VFDANVEVDTDPDRPAPRQTRAALLAELDRHGVERALVWHAHAERRGPLGANRLLEEWLGDDGRLLPLWSALPTVESLAQIKALHAQGRVRCVRLSEPRPCGLPFRPWAYDALLSFLTHEHIPLWIGIPGCQPDEVVSTLQGYPGLVTVLYGAHYVHALWLRPMLQALPNAHLELSRYEPLGEVEALRQEFGATRLLYGSWYARYVMGPMLYYLHHTSLSDAELALICAGNLERILRGESQHD